MNGKSIFSFLLGAAIGSAVTYFFTKERVEKRAMEDISAMEECFKKQYGVEETPVETVTEEAPAVEETTPEVQSTHINDTKKNKVRYDGFAKVKNKLGLSKDKPLLYNDSEDNLTVRKKVGTKMNEPYIIGEEEFDELQNEPNWDAMEVYFDPQAIENRYFTNAEGEEISMDSIGSEAIEFLSNEADDGEVVFVRNDELQMVFEIMVQLFNPGGDD